jgi:hypothetical protein
MFPKRHIAEAIKGVQVAIHFEPYLDRNSCWCGEDEEARSKKKERLEGLCHFVFEVDKLMTFWNERVVVRKEEEG